MDTGTKIGLIGVGLFLIIVGCYLFFSLEYKRYKLIKAGRTWPIVTGIETGTEIERGIMEDDSGLFIREKPYYTAKVTYRYSVAGIEYTGNFILDSKTTREEAKDILEQKPWEIISVRYNPENPPESITNYEIRTFSISGILYFFFIAGALFLIPGIFYH